MKWRFPFSQRPFTRSRIQLDLPWERHGLWFLRVLAGPRSKWLVLGGILFGALMFVWKVADRRERMRMTVAAISELERAVSTFRAEMGRCPHSMVELVHPPVASARLLSRLPTDGWGRALSVRCPSRVDPDRADIVSAGPSGSFFEDDNIP